MSICIIFNPQSGRRKSRRRLDRFLATWDGQATLWPTQRPHHARELGRQAAEEGFATVAAAGGDGTVHEVANGILHARSQAATLAVVPIGSANDYAYSLIGQFGAWELDDDHFAQVDVGHLHTSSARPRYFIESVGIGLSARVTLESLAIGWQGIARYGLGAYRAIRQNMTAPRLRLGWDEQPAIELPTLMVSLLVGRREGNFPLAPAALLDDGLFDFVHAGRLSRWQAIAMLPRLAFWGPDPRHPQLRLGRCRSLEVQSAEPLVIHTDGEMFSTPGDGVRDARIELLPGRLRVKAIRL
jgi:diacylglycerol kinase family enzyme